MISKLIVNFVDMAPADERPQKATRFACLRGWDVRYGCCNLTTGLHSRIL